MRQFQRLCVSMCAGDYIMAFGIFIFNRPNCEEVNSLSLKYGMRKGTWSV